MIGLLLAVTANAEPLTADDLIKALVIVALVTFVLTLYDGGAELDGVRDEIDALPVVRRRDVLRILDARRWR